jgi:hypothetical protein
LPSGYIWFELSALDHILEESGDFALLAVKHIEDLPKLVTLPLDLVAKIQESQSSYDNRHDGNVFAVHGIISLERNSD